MHKWLQCGSNYGTLFHYLSWIFLYIPEMIFRYFCKRKAGSAFHKRTCTVTWDTTDEGDAWPSKKKKFFWRLEATLSPFWRNKHLKFVMMELSTELRECSHPILGFSSSSSPPSPLGHDSHPSFDQATSGTGASRSFRHSPTYTFPPAPYSSPL